VGDRSGPEAGAGGADQAFTFKNGVKELARVAKDPQVILSVLPKAAMIFLSADNETRAGETLDEILAEVRRLPQMGFGTTWTHGWVGRASARPVGGGSRCAQGRAAAVAVARCRASRRRPRLPPGGQRDGRDRLGAVRDVLSPAPPRLLSPKAGGRRPTSSCGRRWRSTGLWGRRGTCGRGRRCSRRRRRCQ
jgi:hypothetical protein